MMVIKTSAARFAYDAESDADFDVSIVILPIKDKTLALPYANHNTLYEILTNRPEIQEYGYWNNTDKHDNVSDEEWEQRKIDWDTALVRVGIPKDNGMVLHIVDAVNDVVELNYINVRRDFMGLLVDDVELLKKVAHGVILSREYNRLLTEYAGDNKEKMMQYGMKCLRLATEYIQKHPEEVEKEKDNYRHMFNSQEFFSVALYSN